MYRKGIKLRKLKTHKQSEEKREVKDRTIRIIRARFEEEVDYYKPKKAGNFWNNNYIEYENKNLSLEEYLE